jgi:gluconolactonase
MNRTSIWIVALTLFGAAGVCAAAEGPGIQASADAREAQVLQTECKVLQPGPPLDIAALARRAGGNPAEAKKSYQVTAVPGIVKEGVRWKVLWSVPGDDADGIVPTSDGGILIARNDDSDVVKLTSDGRHSVAYKDTNTGGALSQNKKGDLFIVERGLRAAIWQLAPQRKLLANRYMDGPFDCIGGVLNDLVAPSFGGVYFTQGASPNGGLFYAAPDGTVTHYGTELRTNGIMLSPNEETLYVTNAGTLVAFDVQANGALANQRTLASWPGGGGDGGTVDSQGNIYVTGFAGVRVISPDGKVLGTIPAPLDLISVAFSGKDKRTLFAVGEVRTNKPNLDRGIAGLFDHMEVMSIPMEAKGYEGRPK